MDRVLAGHPCRQYGKPCRTDNPADTVPQCGPGGFVARDAQAACSGPPGPTTRRRHRHRPAWIAGPVGPRLTRGSPPRASRNSDPRRQPRPRPAEAPSAGWTPTGPNRQRVVGQRRPAARAGLVAVVGDRGWKKPLTRPPRWPPRPPWSGCSPRKTGLRSCFEKKGRKE